MAGLIFKKSLPLSRSLCSSRIDQLRACKKACFSLRTDDEVKAMFEEWVIKHGKSYNTLIEKEKRFEIFRDNLKDTDVHNSTGDPSYSQGLNYYSDLTIEEVLARCCGGLPYVQVNEVTAMLFV